MDSSTPSLLFKINTFDDGNQTLKHYQNIWIKTGSRFKGQKISLKNKVDNSIVIKSISSWKVNVITENPS
jgi:hypothetical protein|tara:strand:+ start:70 stop:279 length:210 start_codon:yes stop_codon:yes gene_type:complete